MRTWLRNKIEHWRSRPENERMKIAMRLTWAGGAMAIVIWLTILLPLQIHLSDDSISDPEGSVQGVVDEAQPTITPSPTPLSIFE